MSSHATAILGYGVLFSDSLITKLSADNGYFEIEDLLAETCGLAEPARKDKEAYSEYKKTIKELEKNCPAEICNVGDHESQIYALVMKGLIFSAEERYPTNIDPKKFQIDPTKLTEFQDFCKGVKVKGKEGWILMSRYE